ncbi:hypothetical protein PSET11_01063 [Arthrobacter ulcerisalmonis]|uniref:Uncharacterized protein n=1 Tax=Arthrobacter ulcerisalmonis TaxID=2483813 RepID=A0A3P5X431_9MICC|nr:hypothetical protein PSET11_01063 [Arthrobacter ulcerisalmonis]
MRDGKRHRCHNQDSGSHQPVGTPGCEHEPHQGIGSSGSQPEPTFRTRYLQVPCEVLPAGNPRGARREPQQQKQHHSAGVIQEWSWSQPDQRAQRQDGSQDGADPKEQRTSRGEEPASHHCGQQQQEPLDEQHPAASIGRVASATVAPGKGDRQDRLPRQGNPHRCLLERHLNEAATHQPAEHVLRSQDGSEGERNDRRRGPGVVRENKGKGSGGYARHHEIPPFTQGVRRCNHHHGREGAKPAQQDLDQRHTTQRSGTQSKESHWCKPFGTAPLPQQVASSHRRGCGRQQDGEWLPCAHAQRGQQCTAHQLQGNQDATIDHNCLRRSPPDGSDERERKL